MGGVPPDDLERRRAGARRLAWLIGAAAFAVYALGIYLRR